MKTKSLVQGSLVAAIYTVLTIAVAPIASGLIQCRISEALCVLPFFMPAAVPGLFIGCLVSNIITGAEFMDVILGSLASLLAALSAYGLSKRCFTKKHIKWFVPLPAVLFNAALVGYVLAYVYMLIEAGVSYWMCALYVAIGQIGACYILGIPLFLVLDKYKEKIFAS